MRVCYIADTLRSVARPAITSEIVIQPVPAGVKKAATFACTAIIIIFIVMI